ncbi:MAG: peptide chain release factor N(5)-glutamine methyltransferase [Cyanobacteria bacterium P01_G01_bin.54]
MPFYAAKEILLWRSQAQAAAIATDISAYEIDYLLQALGGIDRLRLCQALPQELLELQVPLPQLEQLWQQRLQQRQPLQHLLGHAAWREWQIQVSPDVLIPRPETEQIIDLVADCVATHPQRSQGHWVDLGTGSGILACGLAGLLPLAQIHAVDCSAAALAIANTNIQRLGFSDRIQLYTGSWWQPLTHLRGQVQGMVANPPYIPTAAITELEPEVRDHEPRLALDGGADGLVAVRQLLQAAPAYLMPGGLWLVELMQGQAAQVRTWLAEHPAYTQPQVMMDWSGRERFVLAWRQ